MPPSPSRIKKQTGNQFRQRTLPPGQQLVADGKWPIIGERAPLQTALPHQLEICGMVSEPTTYNLEDLSGLPQTCRQIDIHCVTRWSKLGVEFTGILLAELLDRSGFDPAARFVSFVAQSSRDHSSSMSLEQALSLETLIATAADGNPLSVNHGGPIRNIVPGRYFYKSVKWLKRIELLAEDRLGFWETESGYHNNADPWKEERYLAPAIDRRISKKLIESRDFSDQDLRSIDVRDRQLQQLLARQAQLRDADFRNSVLVAADFSGSNLSNAHFQNANLQQALFIDADLEGADFSGSDLRGANLTGCLLTGATFCEFDETGSVIRGAVLDSSTTLPSLCLQPLVPNQRLFVESQLELARKS